MPPLIVAAGALLAPDGHVLVQQRHDGALAGLWEFPGGKLEPGESAEAALVRELEEELAVTVDIDALVPVGFGTGRAGERALVLLLFAARRWRGEPRALAAGALRWATVAELDLLPMPAPDRPLVTALRRLLSPASPSARR